MAEAATATDSTWTGPVVLGEELAKRYGEGEAAVDALRGVDVAFAPGSFTAIMGASGSGKSTLMHVLAGLDRPTGGTVKLDGRTLGDLNDKELTRLRRERIGFVFQSFNLIPVLSAEENVLLPLEIADGKPDQQWLEQLLVATGLQDRRRHRPSELSGGQQQRVAIARALVTRPAVVFADEPTGNLDSNASEDVLGLLRKAVDEYGQAVVMVTHDAMAAARADEVVFLADGQIVGRRAKPTPEQILDELKALRT